jgi:arylsulfatase A-like enzyme
VIHWPKGIKAKGELRHQFHHVIDVAPTILEASKLPEPYMVDSVAQVPMQRVSMPHSFDDANAGERRESMGIVRHK